MKKKETAKGEANETRKSPFPGSLFPLSFALARMPTETKERRKEKTKNLTSCAVDIPATLSTALTTLAACAGRAWSEWRCLHSRI